jgi:hypothetical protein
VVDVDVRDIQRLAFDQQNIAEAETRRCSSSRRPSRTTPDASLASTPRRGRSRRSPSGLDSRRCIRYWPRPSPWGRGFRSPPPGSKKPPSEQHTPRPIDSHHASHHSLKAPPKTRTIPGHIVFRRGIGPQVICVKVLDPPSHRGFVIAVRLAELLLEVRFFRSNHAEPHHHHEWNQQYQQPCVGKGQPQTNLQ